MSVRYHVIPSQEGVWRVKRSGAHRAISVHSTQREAFGKARELAMKDVGDVIIHRVDGTIRRSTTFAKDPHPRREQSHLKK